MWNCTSQSCIESLIASQKSGRNWTRATYNVQILQFSSRVAMWSIIKITTNHWPFIIICIFSFILLPLFSLLILRLQMFHSFSGKSELFFFSLLWLFLRSCQSFSFHKSGLISILLPYDFVFLSFFYPLLLYNFFFFYQSTKSFIY